MNDKLLSLVVVLVSLRCDFWKSNMKSHDFILKSHSQILSVEINIRYVDLVVQVGFLGKCQTYDLHGIKE